MLKRYLRKLLKRIYIILSKLARSFSKKRRKIRRGFGHELSHKTNNIYAKNTNIAKLEEKTKSEFQSAQPISSYKEDNVVQNSKGDGNILVGVVGGNLTINYRRPVDRPFQAPNLPTNFVDRPDISRSLKAGLLANTTSNSGVLLVSALHGLGGIGKTTLVAALAHDTDIQKRFSGGVLWATLGQTPDIISLLSSWVKALGDYEFPARTIEETSNHLRGLLQEKAVLLVVDDVWDSDHLKPFLVASSQSQVIVTSRRVDVADGVTAKLTELNLMTPEESLALLSKSLERELITGEGQEALQVAKAVGYLPLALNLVAARVKRGVAWSELEAALKAEVARLEELEGPRSKQALEATFNLSLKALKDYSEAAWHNFIWLGVLPEDVTITAPMTANLWDISVTDAKKRLELLWNDALLQSNSPVEIAGASWNSYRMHDLLHDVARRLLTSTAGIGISLPEAHRKLLARYQQKTQNGQWHTLADDGYIHQRLVWHLEQAQWTEEIHQLLRETAANGRNGWYEARERLGQTAGYISDISRIWEIVDANQTPTSKIIGWQCRYALIVASLNSLAKNIPPALLVALVRKQVWTPEQGLAYALQIPEPQQKVTALTELAEIENCLSVILKEKALQSALKAAQAIEDERYRADALSAIAPKLPETLLPEALKAAQAIESEYLRVLALSAIADKLPEVLPLILKAAQAIKDEQHRAKALSAIADKLPEVLPKALKAAQAIKDEQHRAEALSAIADKLPEVLPEALKAAQAIEYNDLARAHALRALADKLPETLLPEALKAAQAIKNEEYRTLALRALADKLPETLLPEALKASQGIESEYLRALALSAIADKLPEVLPEALKAAQAIEYERYRAEALSAIADKLPEVLPEALKAAQAIEDERDRAEALSAIADKLPETLLPEALKAAQAFEYKRCRAEALRALADKLPAVLPEAHKAALAIEDESDRAEALRALADKLPAVLPEALKAAQAIKDEQYRAEALRALADKLPAVLPEALKAAQAIKDEQYRAEALRALADKLPAVLPLILKAAQAFEYEQYRAEALSAIAPKLPETFLPEALKAAQAIEDERYRAEALIAIAPKLPESLLPEALKAAQAIEDERYRAYALIAIAPKLPETLLPEALKASQGIESEYLRAEALSAIADKLPEVLPLILKAALAIEHEYYRAEALRAIADKLPEMLPEALKAAQAIEEEWYRAYALIAIADKLPEVLPEALKAAQAIESECNRVRVLIAIAPKLPEMLPEALKAAQAFESEKYRAEALIAIAPKLPETLLPEALKAAQAFENEEYRAEALIAIAPKLPETLLPEALKAAQAFEYERYRAQALSAIATKLPENLLPEALKAAQAIEEEYNRAEALRALAPHLSQMPEVKLFSLWKDTLHSLSLRTRPNLLRDLAELEPVIFALGGEAVLEDLFHAIQDVAKWWR